MKRLEPNIYTCVQYRSLKLVKVLLVSSTIFISLPFAAVAGQPSQVLFMVENKRLEASICPDSMNRLAVANDRIVQVFGDEGAFENQSEENTGQVFIKPTAENSLKPLSLTLITEQGKTQDLSLKPTAKSATTLILKTSDKPQKHAPIESLDSAERPNVHAPSLHLEKNLPVQEQMLSILKQAVGGSLSLKEDTPPTRSNPEGYSLAPYQSFQAGEYVIHAFHLENTTSTAIDVQEKTFYQPGDLAISIQNRVLASHAKTVLYVVRRAGESIA